MVHGIGIRVTMSDPRPMTFRLVDASQRMVTPVVIPQNRHAGGDTKTILICRTGLSSTFHARRSRVTFGDNTLSWDSLERRPVLLPGCTLQTLYPSPSAHARQGEHRTRDTGDKITVALYAMSSFPDFGFYDGIRRVDIPASCTYKSYCVAVFFHCMLEIKGKGSAPAPIETILRSTTVRSDLHQGQHGSP